ncbi:MAG TPA: DUF1572 family protein [Ferruginibacter sp.]|nr:DUF1572 family protein [Ferruginibacter sp.]
MIDHIKTILARDLDRLQAEIMRYSDEQKIWQIQNGIANSAGNLCLHLVGNLNHFIGAQLGSTGYVRHREVEFSSKNISRAELINAIRDTAAMIHTTLDAMKEDDFTKEYPIEVLEKRTTTGFFLLHLASHFGYHLGQVNYHRRLIDV